MNVLIVTPSYPGPEEPEAGIFIHRQVQQLVRRGAHCRVLTFQPAPPPFPRWIVRRSWWRHYANRHSLRREVDGIQVETALYRREWAAGEDVVPAIGEALCRQAGENGAPGVDVVYAQFLWTGGAGALALRERYGWPVAAIARGGEMEQWHATSLHCRRHVVRVLEEVDQPLANCHRLRVKAEQLVPAVSSRIEVIYNGCDVAAFRPAGDKQAARLAAGFGSHDRVAMFCGSIESVKGIDELASAWDDFTTRFPEWRLLVVGRVVEPRLAARLAALGPRVTLTGGVPPSSVAACLQAADLYLQPSRLEGIANASMEAMAAGLPVIATDVGGQAELVDHGVNGWLIPPGDHRALTAALASAAADPAALLRAGAEARRKMENSFDHQVHGAKLAAVLERTVARRAFRGH